MLSSYLNSLDNAHLARLSLARTRVYSLIGLIRIDMVKRTRRDSRSFEHEFLDLTLRNVTESSFAYKNLIKITFDSS